MRFGISDISSPISDEPVGNYIPVNTPTLQADPQPNTSSFTPRLTPRDGGSDTDVPINGIGVPVIPGLSGGDSGGGSSGGGSGGGPILRPTEDTVDRPVTPTDGGSTGGGDTSSGGSTGSGDTSSTDKLIDIVAKYANGLGGNVGGGLVASPVGTTATDSSSSSSSSGILIVVAIVVIGGIMYYRHKHKKGAA